VIRTMLRAAGWTLLVFNGFVALVCIEGFVFGAGFDALWVGVMAVCAAALGVLILLDD